MDPNRFKQWWEEEGLTFLGMGSAPEFIARMAFYEGYIQGVSYAKEVILRNRNDVTTETE